MTDVTDAEIGDYYDRYQGHLVVDLPKDRRVYLRFRYIESARRNPEALRQIWAALDEETGT